MPYQQLSNNERYIICYMNRANFSPAAIGQHLGRHRATISRELKRNRHQGPRGEHYLYDIAQHQTDRRRLQTNQRYKLEDSALGQYVKQKLREHWAPEQIVGRRLSDHPNDPSMGVSHETIYQWIYRQKQGLWHLYLRRKHPRRRPHRPCREARGQIPGRVGIEHRPPVVDTRSRFGDWESDTVEGAKGGGGLATHVERKSRYLVVGKLLDKRAETFTRVSVRGLGRMPRALRKTLTCDNGKEFAGHEKMGRRLGLDVYFARPYSPWQRGLNENTNGLLREFFPTGTDFSRVSHRKVAKVQRMLNTRPRKCLNYRTPAEVLSDLPGVALRN